MTPPKQSEFVTVTVPAEDLRPVPKKKRKAKSPAPKEPVAREPALRLHLVCKKGFEHCVLHLRSRLKVPG